MIAQNGFHSAQRFRTLHGPLRTFQDVVTQDLGDVIAFRHVEKQRDSPISTRFADGAKHGIVDSVVHHHQARILPFTSLPSTNLDHRIVFHNKAITRLHH